MPAAKYLAPDQVDALFAGTLAPQTPPGGPESASRDYSARYDRCDGCRAITPCLVTFRGRLDWAPELAEKAPLRAAVESLRASTGKRTILLCGPCMSRLNTAVPDNQPPDGRLPIAWD